MLPVDQGALHDGVPIYSTAERSGAPSVLSKLLQGRHDACSVHASPSFDRPSNVDLPADDGDAGHFSGTYIPSPYPRRVSVASWVDVQAGRLVARSNWDRYTPRVRIAWAVVCWLVGLTVNVIVLAVRNADVLYIVVWTVAIQSWLALMLAAYESAERRATVTVSR